MPGSKYANLHAHNNPSYMSTNVASIHLYIFNNQLRENSRNAILSVRIDNEAVIGLLLM